MPQSLYHYLLTCSPGPYLSPSPTYQSLYHYPFIYFPQDLAPTLLQPCFLSIPCPNLAQTLPTPALLFAQTFRQPCSTPCLKLAPTLHWRSIKLPNYAIDLGLTSPPQKVTAPAHLQPRQMKDSMIFDKIDKAEF